MSITNVIIGASSSEIAKVFCKKLAKNPDVKMILTTRKKYSSFSDTDNIKIIYSTDLCKSEDCEKVAEAAKSLFSGPFAYIHFAGDFWEHKDIQSTEYIEIRNMMNSHWLTLVTATKALIPIMIKVGGGSIIAFSCNSVRYNYPEMSPFTCAKAAVECYIKCIANEYMKDNILANTIALPTILTNKVIIYKPTINRKNYITPTQVADFLYNSALSFPSIQTGNVLQIVKYNRSFFEQGYFQRNPTA